jgi:hypothetical protein
MAWLQKKLTTVYVDRSGARVRQPFLGRRVRRTRRARGGDSSRIACNAGQSGKLKADPKRCLEASGQLRGPGLPKGSRPLSDRSLAAGN